jgi:hypothetical protein
MRSTRPALALAVSGLVAGSSFAFAAAPATVTTQGSKTLYLSQVGCGTTAQDGTLETSAQTDTADGCGTIGGLPVNEVNYQIGGTGDDYTSTGKLGTVMGSNAKKVTGEIAVGSWVGAPAGGVGNVDIDVTLVALTTAGKTIDFGATTATAKAGQTTPTVSVPFSLAVPAAANGATLKSFTLNVFVHGANLGMSAKKLSGSSFVIIPTKTVTKKKK